MGRGGDTFKGAAGGAATGATIGSVGGPYGAVIGGAIGAVGGGLMGYFGSDDNDPEKKRMEDFRKQVAERGIPQVGPASLGQVSGYRANQQELVRRLEAMSRGEGPSLATEQLKQATDRNVAQQMSMAQSGRGNATLANIVASNNIGQLGQGAAQQAAIARIAEQQMAMQQLGGAVQQGRAADEDLSRFNAMQQNFADQANLEAKLRAMGLNDEAILRVMKMQQDRAMQPTVGDQLLAGGTGSLGMWAANQKKAS